MADPAMKLQVQVSSHPLIMHLLTHLLQPLGHTANLQMVLDTIKTSWCIMRDNQVVCNTTSMVYTHHHQVALLKVVS